MNNINHQNIQIQNEPQIIFNYEGVEIIIQCNINDKMKDIINNFLNKIENKENNLFYLYNGWQINKELTFNEQANEFDKNRKIINILVSKSEKEIEEQEEIIISKDIICPQCKENALIDINNFKINFQDCKNGHNISDIKLIEFEQTQKINLNSIRCQICNKNHKSNKSNHEFYICNTCNKNICHICKSIHNKNHIIINYDDKDCFCERHTDEKFSQYCKTCKKDICMICRNAHEKHDILDFDDIIIKDYDTSKTMKDLNDSIESFKNKILLIKKVFMRFINTLDIYYEFNKIIIDNFNLNKRNYYKLQNLYNLKTYNERMIKYINNIIKDNYIFEIYKFPNEEYYISENGIYLGEMKRSAFFFSYKHGKGEEYFNNGDIYEGDFKDGKFEGKGIYYFNNGDRYEGDFKDGKFEGKGTYYFKNGNRFEGNYKNDKKEGEGIMYYSNGDSEKGFWINDELKK